MTNNTQQRRRVGNITITGTKTKRTTISTAIMIAIFLLSVLAIQTVEAASPMYANSVVGYLQGKRKDGSFVLPERSNPNNALGPPDSSGTLVKFFSLGFGGWIILGFPNPIGNGVGYDVLVVEVTWGSYPLEQADVYVSQDLSSWTKAGTVNNKGVNQVYLLMSCAKYVKIVDTSDKNLFDDTGDGFDLDAVGAYYVCPPGTVCGSIFFDATDVVVTGISFTVDLYQDGALVQWMTTTTGTYSFGNLLPGDYSVELVSPSGWVVTDSPQDATVSAGGTTTVNFHVFTVVTTTDIRSIGFWKHQFAVATGGKGRAQYTSTQLQAFLDFIKTYWGSSFAGSLGLQSAYQILNPDEPASMQDRAEQQVLALMLNVASGKVGTGNMVDLSAFGLGRVNVGQAIQYCLTNLDVNPELVKDIADTINNGLVFA